MLYCIIISRLLSKPVIYKGLRPMGHTFHFSQYCQTSAGAQVHHLKQSSPNLPLRFHLSLLSLPYPIFPNSSIVPLPSVYPHHPFTTPSSFFPSIPYFSIPPHTFHPLSPIPPTSLISSFNSLYFVYFLPASLPSHDINLNPRFIFSP